MYNKPKNKLIPSREPTTEGGGEHIVFRPTQISGEFPMKRYTQPQPDFPVGHLAEKIPIHYRSSRKQIIPIASASAQDVHATSSAPVTPDLMAGDGVGPEHGGGGSGIGENGGQNSSNSLFSSQAQKAPAFLPGDRVIFAESPSAPGIPVVYRTSEERASNQDRLNLDRRKLTVCPILEGEEQLRLLNYQHNMITKVQHLGSLKRLIFLDLYDNQIEEISGLNALKSLRVLMLGKNKIKRIDNLDSLNKLDVLDLHGNQITVIENMNHLTELRVLNLAGNMVVHVDNLTGMDSLAELNLRRNKIRTVNDVDSLPSLQRLFLSFNEIASFEDIACLGESNSLSEVTLDGNPLTNDQYYKQIVLRHMQQLKQLDMKRVTEEERRIALVMARKDEEKKKEGNKMAIMKEKKRLAINNAKRQWEVMQGSMMSKTGKLVKTPELYASLVGSVPNSELMLTPSLDGEDNDLDSLESNEKPGSQSESRPGSAHSGNQDGERPRTANKANKPENKQGSYKETMIFGGQDSRNTDLNNLADLDGDTLTMYGHQSLEALDRNWGIQAAGAVTKIVFKFMDMDEITKHLHKIRTRFPGVQTLVFSATNIRSLNQINALTSVRRLDNLTIDEEGNPVTKFTLWRLYTIFRLAHFALKKVNDIEVSSSDIVNAEKLFGAVAHITTSQLPQSRLLSLLGETRRKQLLAMSEEKSRKVLDGTVKLDKAQGEFVGRAGLSYQTNESSANKESKKAFARSYINEITKEAIFTDRKRNELLKIWPQIFYEMVYSSLMDMSDLQGYMKKCLEELEKG